MLNQDYKDMLQILQKYDVDYILVGAYALAAHGYPRSTLDMDIWVNPTESNSSKIYKVLAEFGAPLHGIAEDTFEKRGIIFQIGVAPCRIDFITEISGNIETFPSLALSRTLFKYKSASVGLFVSFNASAAISSTSEYRISLLL